MYRYNIDDVKAHFSALQVSLTTTILDSNFKESKCIHINTLCDCLQNPMRWGFGTIQDTMICAYEYVHHDKFTYDKYYHSRLLFIDDVTPAGLALLRQQDLHPAAVVETSQDNYHVWILLPSEDVMAWERMQRPARRRIERYLVSQLRTINGGGDYRAATGKHNGRIAGTWNPPNAKRNYGYLARLVDGSGYVLPLDRAVQLITDADRHAETDRPARREKADADRSVSTGEYYDDRIIEALTWLVDRPYDKRGNDLSAEDFYFARKLALAGFREEDVIIVMENHGPNNFESRDKSSDYIRLTAEAAYNDPRVDRIGAMLAHCYEKPDIIQKYSELAAAEETPHKKTWFIACHLAKAGYCQDDVQKVLIEGDPISLLDQSNPAEYVAKTVSNAVTNTSRIMTPAQKQGLRQAVRRKQAQTLRAAQAKATSRQGPKM